MTNNNSFEGDLFMPETQSQEQSQLGSLAVGSIDPQGRIESGEIKAETIDRLINGIDSYYKPVSSSLSIPKWCVDGRCDEECATLAPNAAGGTYSLVVGDALVDAPALIENKKTSASHAADVFDSLMENGYEIGGHSDNHAHGENVGCGACDKMEPILTFITEHTAELAGVASQLGVEITKELQARINTNAQSLLDAGYVDNGKRMIDTIGQEAGADHVQTLQGQHNEVALVVNTQEGTTLDRRDLADEFGNEYQAFNLDVWALKNGIDAMTNTDTEAEEKFAAAVIYNLATAHVLAGPSLRTVVR